MGIGWRKFKYRMGLHRRPRQKTRQRRPMTGWIWRPAVFLTGMLLLCGWGLFKIEHRLGGLAQEVAVSALQDDLLIEANRAVMEVLEEQNITADSLLAVEKAEDGAIRSMTTDHTKVNRIKTELTIKVQGQLERHRVVKAYLPAGMLISDTMLTGVGIPIPIQAFVFHDAEVQLYDTFDSAGINQTRYKLMMEVRVPMRVAGVFSYQDEEVVVQVPLAETVIVGSVPQTYLESGRY